VIPEAAVEAACNHFWYAEKNTAVWEAEVRRALEAAAPHMLAGAWDEGAQAGFDSTAEGFNGECVFDHCAPDGYPPTNPYSGEKWEVADWEPTP
jgi:hypothetical protein